VDRIYYFAYGSNLHPPRLAERVPSSRLHGLARLRGHRLVFHKRGGDGSGKCNVHSTGRHQDIVHGAVFSMARAEVRLLDRVEGVGHGYWRVARPLSVGGRPIRVFYYLAQADFIQEDLPPFDWYHALVLAGARGHRFPADYLHRIAAIATVRDPDAHRDRHHRRLLGYPRTGRSALPRKT